MNFKFWKKKPKQVTQIDMVKDSNGSWTMPNAATALKGSQLFKSNLELEAATRTKDQYKTVHEAIQMAVVKGRTQVKIVLLNEDFLSEVARQFPFYHKEIGEGLITFNEYGLGSAQKFFKDELNRLGYGVIVRNITLNIQKVHGSVDSFFAGYELLISWHS
jgi:hypothetical protein